MKTSKKLIIVGTIVGLVAVAGILIAKHFIKVDKENQSVQIMGGADGPTSLFFAGKIPEEEKMTEYVSITMEDAKELFKTPGDYIILDVRRPDEFAEGHIPGAINVANEDIGTQQPKELPDLDKLIYVYCRSGRRSKEASSKLVAMGYTNIIEFGGIIDWTGEVVKDESEAATEEETTMIIKIDDVQIPVTWEENESVKALSDMSPLTIEMSKYGGFEQVGSIGSAITSNDKEITANPGDIVLYSSNQLVVFYGNNTWAYTKLGHIDMTKEELEDLLGNKNVTIILE